MSAKNPKKVLLIGPYPPPYGGIASHMAGLVPVLVKEGFEVFILSTGSKNAMRVNGAKLARVNIKKKSFELLKPWDVPINLKLLRIFKGFGLDIQRAVVETVFSNIIAKVATREKIGLISFYSILNGYSIPVLRNVLNIKAPIVLTIYGAIYEKLDFFRARIRLVKAILNCSNKVLSSSEYCAKSVKLLGIDSSEIESLYYGINLVAFSPNTNKEKVRKDLNVKDEENILLFVGRLNEEMGLDSIMEIIPTILSERNDVVFVIIGARGPLEEEALDLQEEYRNKVYVRTDVPFEELPYYYAACDAVLAPTRDRHACMGMAIKEAMASGKPVIASATGGIPEAVVDGETGILIPVGSDLRVNQKSFRRAILKLVDDHPMRERFGLKARERAEELFDDELTYRKIIDIFEELLEERDE